MKNKRDNIPVVVRKALDLETNWSKKAILQMFDLDFEEHPRLKLCNEYLRENRLLNPKSVKM